MRSFFPTTLGEIIKTYGAGRSFVTSPKDVNKNELIWSQTCMKGLKSPSKGFLIYDLSLDYINKFCNYADTNYS